jgi:hypothetical protein
MKTLLLRLSLVLLLAATARAEKIDLGSGHALLLTVPDNWAAADLPDASPGVPMVGRNARFTTRSGSNDALVITVLPVPADNVSDPANLKVMAEMAMAQFATGSVEGKADLKELRIAGMSGFAATFTDANLVGKPTVKDDYKAMTSCFVYLGDGVLLTATIFTDEIGGRAYSEAMRILKSISVTRPKDVI